MPDKEGVILRDHLASVAKQTSITPVELLEAPDLQPTVSYVWGWWLELNAERGGAGFGPSPITSTGINDWAGLERIEIEPWEVAAIKAIDKLYLKTIAERK